MSMSDCAKCWSTPCECGFDLLFRPPKYLREQAQLLQDVAGFVEAFGNTPFGSDYAVVEAAHERFRKWRIEHHRG